MDKRALIVLGVIFGGLFLTFFGFLLLAMTAMEGGTSRLGGGAKVGVVEVTDVITTSKDIVEDLEAFREDKSIKAILVRIDSPGGSVAPSQEIHDAIVAAKKKKKVVASMATLAASGGYYVAVAADEIVANPGTITGSIGVITQFTDIQGLAKWAKIDLRTFKSGKFKDSGSPFRDMDDEEREYWNGLVMNIYDQFLGAVADGRSMEKDAVAPYADGRVLTGQQAKEAGLVDHLGGMEAAVQRLKELAGIEGKVQLVYPEKDEEEMLRELLSGATASIGGKVRQEIRDAALEAQLPSLWLLPAP